MATTKSKNAPKSSKLTPIRRLKPIHFVVIFISVVLVGVLLLKLSSASTSPDPNVDRLRIVNKAKGELGHHEWDANVLAYTQGNREDWCADFVSWVYYSSGSQFNPGTSNWRIPSVSGLKDYFSAKGAFVYDQGFINPLPGDVVIFKDNASHAGIVESWNGSTLTTIEGNSSNGVNRRSYTRGTTAWAPVTGFGDFVKGAYKKPSK